jgi:hypothetical protein
MKRGRKPEAGIARERRVHIRFTDDEIGRIEGIISVHFAGMSRARFVRESVLERVAIFRSLEEEEVRDETLDT